MPRLVIHGHFYQPPREDPWLELVPTEPSAAPDHDWNARITRECYAPLAAVPVLDEGGIVRRVFNAYEHLSFNVGPTLARWLERHEPGVLGAMVAGDRAAIARTGHGNAMAMPFHHVILPLMSRRDKRTEVRWGIREFRRVFARNPLGMWLPETAVDTETLEVLAEEGIRFTILAPHQVTEPDPAGRPLRWSRDGRSLDLVVYDGPLSHGVAFGELLKDGGWFAHRLLHATRDARGARREDRAPLALRPSPVAVALATDGETYGHHHRFGDLALGVMLDRLTSREDVRIVGAEALVAEVGPAGEAVLVDRTSWSCAHGLGRWQEACGCRMEAGTSQEWRAPLRAGLEVMAAGIDAVVERDWPVELGDWHAVRDAAGPDLDGVADLPDTALALLDAERHRLAMFTSCAWFFDDLARIEPRLVLQHAARALKFLPHDDGEALESALMVALEMAESNDPEDGNGARLWRERVRPGRLGRVRLAAGLAALRDLAPDLLEEFAMPAHDWRLDGDELVIRHIATRHERRFRPEPVVLGVVAHRVHVHEPARGNGGTVVGAGDFPAPIRHLLLELATPLVVEAAVGDSERERLLSGSVPPSEVRSRALAGAWRLVERDGLDVADVVVHGVLDLYALTHAVPTLHERAAAWQHLAAAPKGSARDRLAERMRVAD